MALIGRKMVLGLGLSLAFSACTEGPTGPDAVPNAAVREDVRFQAVAAAGDHPRVVTVEIELLNTSTSNRHLTWGGCGIAIRLYRSDSLVYDSHRDSLACEDILHGAGVLPGRVRLLTYSIVAEASRVSSGHYDVVMVFDGTINDAEVKVEVRAGAVDLKEANSSATTSVEARDDGRRVERTT